MENGFYKLDGELLYAPNFVINANYELRIALYQEYTYPIDGWYYFNTDAEARTFFGLPPKPMEEPLL